MPKPSPPRSPLLKALMNSGQKISAAKGEVILSSDVPHGVMMVEKGFIKRYMISNEGSLGVQIIYGPQDVFPLTHVYKVLLKQSLYDGPENYHYKTMCDSKFSVVDSETFIKAVRSKPQLYSELFSEAGYHLKTCVHLIENISLPNAYQRVAHQIVYWVRNFSHDVSIGKCIDIPLTHQDIADKLGLTRETVSQSMVQLRKARLIKTGRHIVVPDLKKLEEMAYS